MFELSTPVITMTSREIASLVGSRHPDVCRTIERLTEKGVIEGSEPTAYTHEQNGQQYSEYHLDKRSSLIVVAQLCPEFTAKIVDRWQELESQASKPVELTRLDLIEMAREAEIARLESEEARAKAEAKLELQRPIVSAMSRILHTEECKTLQEAAKILDVTCKALTTMMALSKWIYRRNSNGNWLAFEDKRKAGYLIHKYTTVKREDGAFDAAQVRVTPKGMVVLSSMCNQMRDIGRIEYGVAHE